MSRSEGLPYMFRGRPGSAFFALEWKKCLGFILENQFVRPWNDWLTDWMNELVIYVPDQVTAMYYWLLFKFVLFLPLWKWVKDVMTWISIWTAARYSVNGCPNVLLLGGIYNGYFFVDFPSVGCFVFLLGQLLICCKLYISFDWKYSQPFSILF